LLFRLRFLVAVPLALLVGSWVGESLFTNSVSLARVARVDVINTTQRLVQYRTISKQLGALARIAEITEDLYPTWATQLA